MIHSITSSHVAFTYVVADEAHFQRTMRIQTISGRNDAVVHTIEQTVIATNPPHGYTHTITLASCSQQWTDEITLQMLQQTTSRRTTTSCAPHARQWEHFDLAAVHTMHPWTITLSEAVDEASLRDNVYVRTPTGALLDVSIHMTNERKTIHVTPNERYIQIGVYELIIDAGLMSAFGQVLQTPIRATFTTK